MITSLSELEPKSPRAVTTISSLILRVERELSRQHKEQVLPNYVQEGWKAVHGWTYRGGEQPIAGAEISGYSVREFIPVQFYRIVSLSVMAGDTNIPDVTGRSIVYSVYLPRFNQWFLPEGVTIDPTTSDEPEFESVTNHVLLDGIDLAYDNGEEQYLFAEGELDALEQCEIEQRCSMFSAVVTGALRASGLRV